MYGLKVNSKAIEAANKIKKIEGNPLFFFFFKCNCYFCLNLEALEGKKMYLRF